jgi:hypothetical protein
MLKRFKEVEVTDTKETVETTQSNTLTRSQSISILQSKFEIEELYADWEKGVTSRNLVVFKDKFVNSEEELRFFNLLNRALELTIDCKDTPSFVMSNNVCTISWNKHGGVTFSFVFDLRDRVILSNPQLTVESLKEIEKIFLTTFLPSWKKAVVNKDNDWISKFDSSWQFLDTKTVDREWKKLSEMFSEIEKKSIPPDLHFVSPEKIKVEWRMGRTLFEFELLYKDNQFFLSSD